MPGDDRYHSPAIEQQVFLIITRKLSHMSALFILIGISLIVALGFLAAFIWSVRKGQYDDDYTPSVRMLFDEPLKKAAPQHSETDLTPHTNNPE
jgi:cbb3-type cytochrome oxidase maturation protein